MMLMGIMFRLRNVYKVSSPFIKAERGLNVCSKYVYDSTVAKRIAKCASPTLTVSRSFWETFPSMNRSFHAKDKLDPKTHELVYRAQLFNYAFYAQLVTMGTFAVQISVGLYCCFRYAVYGDVVQLSNTLFNHPVFYGWITALIVTGFTLQNCLMLVAAQRAVLRVYYRKDADEYLLVTLDRNPLKSRLTQCGAGQLKPLPIENLRMLLGNHELREKKYFIRTDSFKSNAHYNNLVTGIGYL